MNLITTLLEDLRAVLPAVSNVITEGAATTGSSSQESLRGTPEAVRKAVDATPNTSNHFPTREAYRDMGYAIKAALPDHEPEAFEIFSDWCARWTDGSNDPDIVAADWRRMKPPYRRGASWLYDIAEERSVDGFTKADVWFEAVAESSNPFAMATPARPEAGDTYPVLGIGDILTRPAPRWLLARHIPILGVGFIYSEPGAGKSFLVLDMALNIAFGRPDWHGDVIDAPEDTVVIYIAAEGSYGFANRIKAWLQHHGVTGADASRRFQMIEQTINFMDMEDVKKLLRTVRQVVGLRPCLIVVDTVSRAMPGADENLQKEMTLFVRACDMLRDAFSCAVLGVHHAGKNGDMRGSTVLNGAGDFVFRLSRKKGATIGNLYCEKLKEAPDGWEEPYRFDLVQLEGGQTSLVVDRADMSVGPDVALTPSVSASVLGAMRAAWEAGEPWAKSHLTKERYAVRRMVADFGFSSTAADELLRVWEGSGLIIDELVSQKSKRRGFRVGPTPDKLSPGEGVFS